MYKRNYGYGGRASYGLGGALLKVGSNLAQGKGFGSGALQGVGKAAITPGSAIGAGAELGGALLQKTNNPALQGIGKGLDVASNFAPGGGGIKGAIGDVAGALGGGAGALLGQSVGGSIPFNPESAGAPYRMRGVGLIKAQGGVNTGSAGQESPGGSADIKNIRLLETPEGNQYFSKTDGGYESIGSGIDLKEMLGEEGFRQYMASIGMNPNFDPKTGAITKGFTAAMDPESIAARKGMDPIAYQSQLFREEYFPELGANEKALSAEFMDRNRNEPGVAKRIQDMQGATPQSIASSFYRDMDPATKKNLQRDYMLKQLMGGQGGGQGNY